MVTERRITAAKPARARRDIAGFGPIRHGTKDGVPEDDALTVRIILVPAAGHDPSGRPVPDGRSGDWREW